MATSDSDQYFTYEGRLASFKPSKKRGSTAGGRSTKTLNWPHKSITPDSLAKAGFYFLPFPDNPDNVVCFLCEKAMDGWEAGDDPLHEHVSHSTQCGWAITAAVEAEMENYWKEDPMQSDMVEARKATFAGKWPHEGKKGWKCKTKQLADAGWKYTPVLESDDMATCTYCQLALDGWEQNDKPYDEHHKRSPHCPYFALVEEFKATKKKTARSKTARSSKASRLSTQSVATTMSELPSMADLTAEPEDSVLTTASTMTQGGRKSRAKKAPAKGAKSKAKKQELLPEPKAEIIEVDDYRDELSILSPAPPPPTKAARGKKRGSEAVDESVTILAEAPAPKRRTTRARGSTLTADTTADTSAMTQQYDTEMEDAPAPKKAGARKKGRASNTKAVRKVSALIDSTGASMASLRGPPPVFPDDDEIERQLEADLERHYSDDEDMPHEEALAKGSSYHMFNPAPPEVDDQAVEDELRALENEMHVDELQLAEEPVVEPAQELEQLQVPKKGRKATGTRKPSKQTKAKKAKSLSPPPPEPESEAAEPELEIPERQPEVFEHQPEEIEDEFDASMGSTDTVVKKSDPELEAEEESEPEAEAEVEQQPKEEPKEEQAPPPKRGRGRPPKASLVPQPSPKAPKAAVVIKEQLDEAEEKPVKRGRGRPSKASLLLHSSVVPDPVQPVEAPVEVPVEAAAQVPVEAPVKRGRGRPSQASLASQQSIEADDSKAEEAPAKRGRGRPPKKAGEAVQKTQKKKPRELKDIEAEEEREAMERSVSSQHLSLPPSTPVKMTAPARSAKQSVISPSQSPQASDAENQPPSSKPASSSATKRVALAPVTATPMHGSPSKRNVLAGLQSTTPWTAANLDAVFGTPRLGADKENGVERLLRHGKELTSPEKAMTLGEWIYHNANEAEKKLKHECETMVSKFEDEGSKAMRVLEGLEVE